MRGVSFAILNKPLSTVLEFMQMKLFLEDEDWSPAETTT